MKHIVKRKGHKQTFDERKLYASIFAACLSAHVQTEEAEIIANLVAREVKSWLEKKEEITSREIFEQAYHELNYLNHHAAFMYRTHRDLS